MHRNVFIQTQKFVVHLNFESQISCGKEAVIGFAVANSKLVAQISFLIFIYPKFWIHHQGGLENSFQML